MCPRWIGSKLPPKSPIFINEEARLPSGGALWGGHSCPPLLTLGLFVLCPGSKPESKSTSKAADRSVRSKLAVARLCSPSCFLHERVLRSASHEIRLWTRHLLRSQHRLFVSGRV